MNAEKEIQIYLTANRLWALAKCGLELDSCTDFRALTHNRNRLFSFTVSICSNHYSFCLMRKRIIGVLQASMVLTSEEEEFYELDTLTEYVNDEYLRSYDPSTKLDRVECLNTVSSTCPVVDFMERNDYAVRELDDVPIPTYRSPRLEGYNYDSELSNYKVEGGDVIIWNILNMAKITKERALTNTWDNPALASSPKPKKIGVRKRKQIELQKKYNAAMRKKGFM